MVNHCQAFFQKFLIFFKKCKKNKKVESFFDRTIVFLHLLIQRKANMEIDDFVNQEIQSKLQPIKKRDYFIIQRRCRVAGLFYHMYEYLEYLDKDDGLVAVFEPNNPYDKNAIAIYGGEHFIGYVPRDIAKKIASLPYFVKADLILDLKYKNVNGCIYDILVPRKYIAFIHNIQKSTLKQKIMEWLGIESNTIFNIFLAIVSIALLFILFMICAVDN